MRSSVSHANGAEWLGLQLMPDGQHFRLDLINPSLYNGKLGSPSSSPAP